MALVEMKELLEAGVHFGHRVKRWHPKMRAYIFTERNGIHIIDIQQTIERLGEATELIKDDISNGGALLFVGTKKQAQDSIAEAAERCGMPYVNERWLGGTLTNFRTIRQRIDYLIDLERRRERGEFQRLTKKEILGLEREMSKLNRRLGGIKNMDRLPSLVFITDIRREQIALKEANKLDIPVIAMVDTNCDPTPIDYVIPANDDAIRSIRLVSNKLADAVIEGQHIRAALLAEEEQEIAEEAEEWAEYEPEEQVRMTVGDFTAQPETDSEQAEEDGAERAEETREFERESVARRGAKVDDTEQIGEEE